MSRTTAVKFRVACPERKVDARSYDTALRLLAMIEALGACREEHSIESFVDGEWRPVHKNSNDTED
jgi:hypothetical protein